MTVLIPLLLIGVMVAFNALYVAAEFATVGSRRSRVQEDAESGSSAAAGLLAILQDPRRLDNYVAACQIGITLSSLVAGAYGQAALTPLLEDLFGTSARAVAVVIVLVAITSLQVVLGELLPKTAVLRYPERLATATLVPMRISGWLFRPLVALFNGSAFRLMRAWNLETEHSHAHVHFKREQTHAILVVDEFGGTLGLVTLDDLIAEVMDDQVAPASAEVVRHEDGSVSVDDGVTLSDLRDDHGLDLTHPDVTTVAGLVLAAYGTVPEVGTVVESGRGATLEVEAVDGRRISRIRIRPAQG